jgi:hypothetical protein
MKFKTQFITWLLLLSCSGLYAQATDVDCVKCIDSKDIAGEAVTTFKLRQQSVIAGKIASEAVTTSKIRQQAVTSAKIKNGAITDKKLSPALSDSIAENSGGTATNQESIQSIEGSIAGIESELQRIDTLESEQAVQDRNNSATDLNFAFPLTWMGQQLFSCGQEYLYGCGIAHSGDGTFFGAVSYRTRSNSLRFVEVSESDLRLWAVPVTVRDFSELRFVGEANLYGNRGMGRILVDDCDNPTVALLDNARNPRPDDNGPETIMNNAGIVYSRDSEIPTQVDVTGNTYGVMNFIQSEDPTPICTPGVSDRKGVWDQFTYTMAEDTNHVRFDGPYTYDGSSVGLIDQVEALEARIEALEAALN